MGEIGNLGKRIEDLERLLPPPKDAGAELRQAVMRDTLNEISALKSCRATNSYRGTTPIQPTDPAGEALGYPYTTGQLIEFAIRRVFERERDEAPDILTHEATEDLIASWTEAWREHPGLGERWDEIEASEPPAFSQPRWS